MAEEELHEAVAQNDLKAVEEIIALKKQDKLLQTTNRHGYTPLYTACMRRTSVEMVRLLLKHGAPVDQKGDDRETPLYIAVHNGLRDVVPFLLAAGANVNETNGRDGDTALHVACRLGFEGLTLMLIDANANINIRNARMETPLYAAAKNGKHDIVYQLLLRDANRNLGNEEGKNPLYIASENEHRACVDLLKVEKKYLKEAKAQVDVDLKMQKPPMKTTEQLMVQTSKDELEEMAPAKKPVEAALAKKKAEPVPPKKVPPPPPPPSESEEKPTPVEVRPFVKGTHDPLTGKPYDHFKSLLEAGPRAPPEIPYGVKQDVAENYNTNTGGTRMVVGTGTDAVVKQPVLLSSIPGDDDSMSFGNVVVKKAK